MRVKLCVILPDLPGTILQRQSPEDGDAGVHHVDLLEMFHLDPGPGCPGSATLPVMDGVVPALLTAHRPVTAAALDEGGGGGDLLVTAQAHRHCQLLRTNHHRALFKYQLTLLNVLGGSQESSQHVGPLNLGLEYVNIESKTGNLV